MFESIIAIVIIGGAIGFAWFYLNQSKKRRAEETAAEELRIAREVASIAGLPVGERPVCANDPHFEGSGQCLARDILDDGSAHNSKHVNSAFRVAYWSAKDNGGSELVAFQAAMRAAQWRSGSQEQVFDRIQSKTSLINEAQRDILKEAAKEEYPSGFGTV